MVDLLIIIVWLLVLAAFSHSQQVADQGIQSI